MDLYRGFAEELPFDDNSFNHAFFFISLEFVDDPVKSLAEACRVAKDKVFIGFINRYALKGVQLRLQGLFTPSIYNHARFFSVWELKRMARGIIGRGAHPLADRLPIAQCLRKRFYESIEKSAFVSALPLRDLRGNGHLPGAPPPHPSAGIAL